MRLWSALIPLLLLWIDGMHRLEGKPLMSSVHDDGDYLWLEEVEGQRALDWVRQQNTESLDRLYADHYATEVFERHRQTLA